MRTFLTFMLAYSTSAADVPVGEISKHTFDQSKVFPGTTRDYWIYIPRQYDGKTPACVYVNQDGIQFNAVKIDKEGRAVQGGVFDQLIAEKKMPVTIGIFVRPGVVKASSPNSLDRFNRSYEYDSLGNNYARFLIEELLPEVQRKTAQDGRKIILSQDGNDRAIGGTSSGAVCAFTVAWERPDAFRRVFSGIGTYVGLRGANEYPTLIRKVEPKPLRIFLEDGSNDLNIYGGDWWMANQSMERSLKFMGYEVEHDWGTGGHNNQHATQIFPQAMTWLWKDYPKPVMTGACQNDFLRDILIPGEDWKIVAKDCQNVNSIIANASGNIIFSDWNDKKTYIIDGNNVTPWLADIQDVHIRLHCFGSDKRVYGTTGSDQASTEFFSADKTGKRNIILSGVHVLSSVSGSDGQLFLSACKNNDSGGVPRLLMRERENSQIVELGIQSPADSITLSPDQSLLYTRGRGDRWVYSTQIGADGKLSHKQKYFYLHVRDDDAIDACNGMRCDRDGRLWVCTQIGIQVCDQAGRVHCILPIPNGKCYGLAFGGKEFDTVYVAAGDKVYSRKVKVRGANPFEPPIKPQPPRL